MFEAILLALSASFFTATSSVCQRLGARDAECSPKFDVEILLRLVRRPVWLLGIASMIVGFVLQVAALRAGGLAIVQPVLAFELILVYLYLSVLGKRAIPSWDWFAVVSMAVGLGLFIYSASPSNGHVHAKASAWWWAGFGVGAAVLIAIAVAYDWGSRRQTSRLRRAAALGIATGATWGFVAAVIRELSSHLSQGFEGVFTNWSPYVLIGVGLIALVLESNSFSAGSLAASQPGFTITDPLVATLLGVMVFGERIRVGPLELTGEIVSFALIFIGAVILSRSPVVAPATPSKLDQTSP
jgi:drug/metabolite transporter (DMT)-like permease